jgi:hypothetical protein
MSEHDRLLRLAPHQQSRHLILLYNPLSGHGHLDSWNALFVGFLLEAGYQVAALSPDGADLYSRIERKQLAQHQNLRILEWRTPQRSLSERIFSKLARLFKRVVPDALDAVEIEKLKLLEASYLQPQEFAERVADATKQLGQAPTFVFNMYMDLYRDDAIGWRPFAERHKIPWAGIRFVPTTVPPSEAYYQLPTLKGMCFLDEQIQRDYAVVLPQKCFEYLPDVTDASVPTAPSTFATEIKRRAAGRKIVFMGGTIGSNKNLSQWFKVIGQADPADWFFVQLGEVHEQNLSPEDLSAYQHALTSKPENLLIHAEYLPDERQFNEVIALSDVLFAVYRRFSISSNMPGKAAAFDKPILVAEGYLMASRVNQYQIGLAVKEDDATQMLKSLADLTQAQAVRDVARPEHFAHYRQDFSHEALKENFFGFLERALAPAKH